MSILGPLYCLFIPIKALQLVTMILSLSSGHQHNSVIRGNRSHGESERHEKILMCSGSLWLYNWTSCCNYNVVQRGFLRATSNCYKMRLIIFICVKAENKWSLRNARKKGTFKPGEDYKFHYIFCQICFQNDSAKVCTDNRAVYTIYIHITYL